ncbi:MAG: TetR/AcrR family transcriptional regulator [Gammaproteobacteria bacterium]
MGKQRTVQKPKRPKKDAILDAASRMFLERGYHATSITEMARQARISKETVYRYFKSKDGLFAAVIDKELPSYRDVLNISDIESEEMEISEVLIRAGTKLLTILTSDHAMALRRMIFYESLKRPDLGHYYYSFGPVRGYKSFESYFSRYRHKGKESSFDPKDLARYFTGMLLHKTILQCECCVIKNPSKQKIKKLVQQVVRDFLLAFYK